MLNYILAAVATALPAIGVAIGQSKANKSASNAIAIQPSCTQDISRALLLGLAVAETSAIIGLVIALTVIKSSMSLLAAISIMLISALSLVIGFSSAAPISATCMALARQPFVQNNIVNTMLLGLSFIQTPIIFGFVLTLIITNQVNYDIANGLRLIGASMALAAGSIGSVISMGEFSAKVCSMIGYNRHAFKKLFNFALVSQAMIETPILLSLVVGLIIISMQSNNLWHGLTLLAAGMCTGISSIAPGLGSGRTAAASAEEIGKNPDLHSALARTTIFAQAFLDTFVIYGLIISLLIIIK